MPLQKFVGLASPFQDVFGRSLHRPHKEKGTKLKIQFKVLNWTGTVQWYYYINLPNVAEFPKEGLAE